MQNDSVFANEVSRGNTSLYLKKYSMGEVSSPVYQNNKVSLTYYFTINTVTNLNNSQGTLLKLSSGTNYYFRWVANFDNRTVTSSMSVFTTQTASQTYTARWDTPYVNSSNGNIYDWVYYDNSKLSLKEVGIFISANQNAVQAAKYGNYGSGVMTRTDKNPGSAYDNNKKGLQVFYRQSYFTINEGVRYYFKFYSVDKNGDIKYSSVENKILKQATTTYALTVKAGTGGSVNTSGGKYAKGNVISLMATPKTGYSFSNWSVTAGSVANSKAASTSFTMPGSAATVTANFTQNKYKLEFAVTNDGGTVTGTAGSYVYGATVSLKAVPKTGFKFVGWLSDNGGTFANSTAAETTFTMPAGSVTVYACFEAVEYTITAKVGSGSGSVDCAKTKAKYGESVKLTAVPAEGYAFDRWESSDVTISDPTAKTITITMPAKNITVTAKFAEEGAKGTLTSVTLKKTSYAYKGTAIKPDMTVKATVNGTVQTLKSDQYTVTYKNNTNAGTAKVIVTGKGNITGSITKTFKIKKVELYSAKVINASLPWTGKAHKPILTVKAKVNGKTVTLSKSTGYTATYTNNIEPGTATVIVKGKGNFTGTLTTTFKINKLKLSTATITLSKTTMTYTGKALKPKVTVKAKVDGKLVTLEQGVDYTVTYSDNVKAGTAIVTVKGKGHFTGTEVLTFTIKKK